MKILIVDDSRIMRRSIGKVAAEMGLEVLEAENGADALSKLQNNSRDISLIVLDWNMPVMDGYQVLKKIRSISAFNQMPVLMATSDGVESDVKRALVAGATDYLIKPFTKEDIKARIAKLIAPCPVKQAK